MSAGTHPGDHGIVVDGARIATPRITLRPWRDEDAEAALAVFGDDAVTRWLAPAMSVVPDVAAMRTLLAEWAAQDAQAQPPLGRWAVEDAGGRLLGAVALLSLPPAAVDVEIAWQLVPAAWGRGLAAEAGHAAAHYAFAASDADELFAVVRRTNERGRRTALRVGLEWVGTTDKYYGLNLDVYRLSRSDYLAAENAQDELRPPEAATYRASPDVAAFEALMGGEIAGSLEYEQADGVVTLTHTVVSPIFRRQGIGSGLIEFALGSELVRAASAVRTTCPFVVDFVAAHPEFGPVEDVLPPAPSAIMEP